ncbi:hypothetical protein TU12-16_00165 [Vibrio phage ICP2_2006_A]|uniref:Nucleotide modification associated domain-containing protein n=1 Tax=Vibrio phage ICP2_2006_A TaxID=979534 RepID=F1D0Z3_9CAUD|nr:hypothetical protein TU12-16_00165 [Vibrio phage ICP2_2006_A]
MKSIRLNQQIRSEIVSNVLKAWAIENPKPECVGKPSKNTLLDAAYAQWKKDFQLDILFSCGLKDEILNKESHVSLRVVDEHGTEIIYEGMYFKNAGGKNERRPFLPTGALQLTTSSPVYIEWKKQHDEFILQYEQVKKWEQTRADKATEIRAVLDSVNTTKQLLEAWPEIERFMPSGYVDPSKVQLPAILPTLPTGE